MKWRTLAAFVALAGATSISGQRIETQKADRNRIVEVATALNHLTVIELGQPVAQVAGGSSAFKIEWRGDKVFVQPMEPDVATNLFVWTSAGRLNYKLLPAGSIEQMHFAIDQEPSPVAQTPPAAERVNATAEQPAIPAEMLFAGVPVRLVGVQTQKKRVGVVLRDVYEKEGKLYIRYAIRNQSMTSYEAGVPEVVTLKSPRSSQSLRGFGITQLGGKYERRLKSEGNVALHVTYTDARSAVVPPGTETIGFVAVELPAEMEHPTVLRLSFPADSVGPVTAVLVL